MKILISAMPVYYDIAKCKDFISQRVAPNAAIYLLGGILRNDGFEVEILDPYVLQNSGEGKSFDEVLINHVHSADVICLSSNTLNWACTAYAISVIRRKLEKEKIIVVGGIHPTYFYESIINELDVDYIMRGEGEVIILELMRAIDMNHGFEKIDGLVSKKLGLTSKSDIKPILDETIYEKLPLPAYDKMPDKVYHTMLIETSRGCKFNCAFCSVPHRNNWRTFERDVVLDRSKRIIEKYSDKFIENQILVTDDCLTADFQRAEYIMSGLEKYDSKLEFIVETRATDWLRQDGKIGFNAFSNSQIRRILFGIECGYNRGLKKISKGLTIELLEQVIDLLEKKEILYKSYFSFIIGFPWESIDDCLRTIDYAATLVQRSNGIGVVNINWLQWYPSRLWDDREKFKISLSSDIFNHIDYNDKYFLELHPNLSYSDSIYINEYITDYENQCIYLRNA